MRCNVFAKGDKYDRSVEYYIASSPHECFFVKKDGDWWDVTPVIQEREVAPDQEKETRPTEVRPKEEKVATERTKQIPRPRRRKKG